jgi:hypothetical protein
VKCKLFELCVDLILGTINSDVTHWDAIHSQSVPGFLRPFATQFRWLRSLASLFFRPVHMGHIFCIAAIYT